MEEYIYNHEVPRSIRVDQVRTKIGTQFKKFCELQQKFNWNPGNKPSCYRTSQDNDSDYQTYACMYQTPKIN